MFYSQLSLILPVYLNLQLLPSSNSVWPYSNSLNDSKLGEKILCTFQIFQQIQNQNFRFDITPNKNLGGAGGLRHINTCRKKSLYRSIFLDDGILLWCIYVYLWSMLNECKLLRWPGLYTIWRGPETLLRGRVPANLPQIEKKWPEPDFQLPICGLAYRYSTYRNIHRLIYR